MKTLIANIPLTFPVLREDEPAAVTLNFARDSEVMAAARWKVPRGLATQPLLASRAADAREFAVLAAKRWRHYRDTSAAASTIEELRAMIAADSSGEFCFHLTIRAPWFPAGLGGAMVRRTWCHHLIVDFIYVHPAISGKVEPVRGVGVGILQGICYIAESLRCCRVWGEATRDSAPFYEAQLRRSVCDCFFLTEKEIAGFAKQLRLSAAGRE